LAVFSGFAIGHCQALLSNRKRWLADPEPLEALLRAVESP